MAVMTLGAMAMARELPAALRPALAAASTRWYVGSCDGGSLETARIDSWRFLEDKNGDSTTIADRVDLAVRSLICVLWDEAPEEEDIASTLDFFATIADRYGDLEPVLGIVEPGR